MIELTETVLLGYALWTLRCSTSGHVALVKYCDKIKHSNSLIADIEDDYPTTDKVPDLLFPVVQASILECSTYAVVSRLKVSPTYTITVSGGTFGHPDYPQVAITVPKKAVVPKTKLPLQLKVGCCLLSS